VIFETPRLLIRRLAPDDLLPFHEMQSNARVMQYTTARAMTMEENERELRNIQICYDEPGNTFRVWAVERKEDGQFIGTCAIILNKHGENEIGFRLDEKHWNKGYATEITAGLIRYGLEELGLDHLVAYVYEDNIGSWKALDRSAFQLIKKFFNEEEQCWDRYYRIEKH
jgi:RimJ/RimL family protein N-acetyltransferase